MGNLDGTIKIARIERKGSYVVGIWSTATMDGMARAADADVRRSSGASFASGLVESFEVSTMKILLRNVRKIAVERGRNVPDTELRLAFVRSGYLLAGYIPIVQDAILEERSMYNSTRTRNMNSYSNGDGQVRVFYCSEELFVLVPRGGVEHSGL